MTREQIIEGELRKAVDVLAAELVARINLDTITTAVYPRDTGVCPPQTVLDAIQRVSESTDTRITNYRASRAVHRACKAYLQQGRAGAKQ
jgi:hypothetical protein